MKTKSLAAVAAFTAIALAVAGAAFSRSSSAPTLRGVVGPGFSISLKRGGARVTTLKAGRYTFAIRDRSSFHNFTLEQESGGMFERHLTSTAFRGSRAVTVRLKRGRWKYYCSVHESQMFGFFRVT